MHIEETSIPPGPATRPKLLSWEDLHRDFVERHSGLAFYIS
jgi:hypothetical protein